MRKAQGFYELHMLSDITYPELIYTTAYVAGDRDSPSSIWEFMLLVKRCAESNTEDSYATIMSTVKQARDNSLANSIKHDIWSGILDQLVKYENNYTAICSLGETFEHVWGDVDTFNEGGYYANHTFLKVFFSLEESGDLGVEEYAEELDLCDCPRIFWFTIRHNDFEFDEIIFKSADGASWLGYSSEEVLVMPTHLQMIEAGRYYGWPTFTSLAPRYLNMYTEKELRQWVREEQDQD